MKRLPSLLALFLLVASTSPAATTRYIVGTRRAAGQPVTRLLGDDADARAHRVQTFDIIDAFAADLTDEEAAGLRRAPGIRYLTPVVERHALDVETSLAPRASGGPNALSQTIPYGIEMIHARDVWPVARGANVNVAILDTGIDETHPDLAANIRGGTNIFGKSANFHDDHGHGTHVAGIIAALDNNIGVAGVAPEASLWSVKVLGADGAGTDEDLIAATQWVLARKRELGGNWIISMSLGSESDSPGEAEAFRRLVDNGVLAVSASGNSGSTNLSYPAAYPTVLSVGAVDASRTIASFSSGGPILGVVAPGVRVLSTVPVGSVPGGSVRADASYSATPMRGSKRAEVRAEMIFCGHGSPGECNGDAHGKIAVMFRDHKIAFAEKVRNAVDQGAIGAVIYDDVDTPHPVWTLVHRCDGCPADPTLLAYPWPVAVSLTKSDGEKLLQAGGLITVAAWDDDYTQLTGTSMAAPHVAGIAALLWSLDPNATALQIRRVIDLTAHPLGPLRFDIFYGNGLADALNAAKALAPAAFGLPGSPLLPPRRHSAGH